MHFLFDGEFPDPQDTDEEGLLAVGGNLEPETLLRAYRIGAFPWYNEEDPILWWCPDPRLVLFPAEIKVSKSMKQELKKGVFTFSMDTAFFEVIQTCSEIRKNETWISPDIISAYTHLFELGFAHSVEVWKGDELVGGFYGVQLGKVFFGESMFSKISNASKAALIWFCLHCLQEGIQVIDCQQSTAHLLSMGAREISRNQFLDLLNKYAD